ncbi:MAG: glycosyltransferase family 2 protein [Nanoarchaeota archaeon]|nr:glycosyltransferase family 2 protein [Nanoarchaeota archaeon]
MQLVIAIPAYNEEKTIGKVVREIPRSIEGIDDIKIIVVDDGSVDNTAAIAKAEGALVVSHAANEGLGATFSDGINKALLMGADIIVNIDADNQFDPAEIPNLIEPILKGRADMVTGSRFKNAQKIPNMSDLKRFGNRFFVWLINSLTGKKFTDTQCGFRAYSREAALRLNLFGGFTYTQEVLLDLAGKDQKIEEVPIKVIYHSDRKSKISGSLFNYGIQALMIILRTFRDYYPLKFFGLPGLIISGLGFIGALYSFIFWFITGYTTPVKTLFFSAITLLILGFLMVILALVADMLKRIRRNQEEILYRLKKKEYDRQ